MSLEFGAFVGFLNVRNGAKAKRMNISMASRYKLLPCSNFDFIFGLFGFCYIHNRSVVLQSLSSIGYFAKNGTMIQGGTKFVGSRFKPFQSSNFDFKLVSTIYIAQPSLL